MLINSKWR